MIDVRVLDGGGKGKTAIVTSRGQLVVAPLEFSSAYQVTANVINTAFNFIGPKSGQQFVITDILLYADKNVGATDASVVIYEADASNTTTEYKQVLAMEMVKQTSRDITGLNLIVTEGKWLNIKTNDNSIYATIMGYYVNNGS